MGIGGVSSVELSSETEQKLVTDMSITQCIRKSSWKNYWAPTPIDEHNEEPLN